ncbi:type 2 lanthipeptide synthetase LanM family protein [Streptomyces longispororuber]|uniref:type 2 lanthipeptide synthetase LanM family protein n=1 Tax=Streptomyces longispororuber TaxID=68230 RepID=UPI00210D9718|nr:type 2 lanthipeptide synthetase LanM family protein [Streptomyces longispororuber]MCQ4208729.1 type 2 lanthipeptide synthetase LanM family protein [Streptomyces longispororuber]
MKRWLDVFGSEESVATLVGALGFGLDDFQARLGPGAGSIPVPSWVRDLRRRTEAGEPDESLSCLAKGLDTSLVAPAAALIHGSQRELHRRLSELTADSRIAGIADVLCAAWPEQDINAAVVRTMVLELNVARVEGRLHGDTPEDRFADFVRQLGEDSAQSELWAEYSVLLRHLGDILTGWVESRAEFAERLLADVDELDTWCDGGLGDLVDVQFGAGDTHRRGRSVAIVTFTRQKLVYKPRSLASDVAWGEVLSWFHGQGPDYDLVAPRTLAGEDYGWSGFVDHQSCRSDAEVRGFFWRTGALLALNYALCGVDVHHENVIAHGAYPVMVDMEALFHGALPTAGGFWSTPADDLMVDGVLRVGLLPSKLIVRNEGVAHAVETSPVGVEGQQKTLIPVPVPQKAGTDEMRFVEQHVEMPGDTTSRAELNGEVVDARGYASEVEAGFVWTHRAIAQDKSSWSSVLDRFADVEMRHIVRATAYYQCLLEDSKHPDFLRDALDRDRFLARLALTADGTQSWEQLVPSELRDLRRGDVPFFSSLPGSRDLVDSEGITISDVLDEPPIEVARRRLARLDENDLDTQVMLIRRAFDSLEPASTPHTGLVTLDLPDRLTAPEDSLAAAVQLAHSLCDAAIKDGERLGWIGLNFIDEAIWQVGPTTTDLYSGTPGMGLFLSAAARLSGDPRLLEYAELTAGSLHRQAIAFVEQMEDAPAPLLREALTEHADAGAFGVTGSMVYYLTHAAVLHARDDLLDAAERTLTSLDRHIAYDVSYDIISGSAGAILAALALHAVRPQSAALRTAELAAERLLRAAGPTGEGIGWQTRLGPVPLTGMSHGASGIAYALARLHAVRPRPEYPQIIEQVLRYERSTLDAGLGNWPDLRYEEMGGGGGYGMAWCHGAPGVGMSRLGILCSLGRADDATPSLRALADEDLRIAERTARMVHFGSDGAFQSCGNNSICHGDLGNLEFLHLAARHRGDDDGAHRVQRGVAALLELGKDGWLTGQLTPEALPGLMYGRAGVGYNLLRLAYPDQVPSVLLLDPPSRQEAL